MSIAIGARHPRLLIICLVIIAGLGCGGSQIVPGGNVVLISVDTLRADHVGAYGHHRNTTPNLDRFAAESVLFAETAAAAPATLPSHASIFTSLLPSHHGALMNRGFRLAEDATTLAEILRDHGYQTVSFNDGGLLAAEFGLAQGFELYDSTHGKSALSTRVTPAVRWLTDYGDQPFFLFIHTYEVHLPLEPAAEFVEQFRGDYSGPVPDRLGQRTIRRIRSGELEIGAADLAHIIDLYDAAIRSMDAAFSMLIAALEEAGHLDDSLIIVTSDHGEEYGERGRIAVHGPTLFDEVIRVPLIIRFPDAVFASRVVTEQVSGLDILPTVLDVVGIRPPSRLAGRSLVPAARGSRLAERPAFSETARGRLISARTGHWKLLRKGSHSLLFDLARDPLETFNFAGAHPTTVLTLEAAVAGALAEQPRRTVLFDFDEETRSRLEALGYVE